MKKKLFGTLLTALGAVPLLLLGLLLATWFAGTSDSLYLKLQLREITPETTGISDETLAETDAMLADCLRGDPNAFLDENGDVRQVEVFGTLQPVFNEKELTHMEDCRRLFILLKRAILAFAAAGLLLYIAGRRLLRGEARLRRIAGLTALALIVLPLAAFAAWAARDFNAAFNFFHRLLFTNSLWLLDPNTDLLIRICPSGMFMTMGVIIAAAGLLWCAAGTILNWKR